MFLLPDKHKRKRNSLGAVTTCDFGFESVYNYVYDLLPNVSRKLFFNVFLMRNPARIRTRVDGPLAQGQYLGHFPGPKM
jgi:hypothetical protein